MAWQKPANIKEWFSILVRHKKKFFFPAVLVMIVMVVQSHRYPRKYSADAVFQRTNDPLMSKGPGGREIYRNFARIQRHMWEHIRGRDAVEQLINDLQLAQDLPHTPDGELTKEGQLSMREKIKDLQRGLRIHQIHDSGEEVRYRVSFTTEDRKLAPLVANKAVENYVRKVRLELDQLLLNAKSFFEDQVARFRARTIELTAKTLAFQDEHPGLKPDDPRNAARQLDDTLTQYEENNALLSEMEERIAYMADSVDAQPDVIEKVVKVTNPELLRLQERLKKLNDDLAFNREEMRRTTEHPQVINLQNAIEKTMVQMKQIETAEREVVGETELVPNEVKLKAMDDLDRLKADFAAAQKRKENLMAKVESLEVLKRNFWVIREEYLKLSRELSDSEDQLSYWTEQLRKTRLALQHEVSQQGIRMDIYERASDSNKPSEPKWAKIVGVAIGAGIAVGLVFVVLAELFDHSFHSVDQAVNQLKLPVLGAVDEIVTPSEAFRRRIVSWGLFPAVGVFLVLLLGGSIFLTWYSLEYPEQFDRLSSQPVEFVKDLVR